MSNINICTVENYDTKHISVCKPYSVNENTYIFNIKYMKNMFLIQTPVCIIPYSYSLYDNNSFKLDVICETSNMYKMLNDCCSYIINKIKKYNKDFISNKNVVDLCTNVQDKYKLSLKNKDASNVYAFNSREETISLTTLHTFDKIICLFELQRLIIKNDKIFWQTNLVQIKKCSHTIQPSFSECLITGLDTNSNQDSNKFGKYTRMFQMKIPVEAIKHKMIMDGLTEIEFKRWSTDLIANNKPKSPPLPPPPPPPLPSLNNLVSKNNSVKSDIKAPEFLKDISLGNFRLRKTEPNDIKQKILSTVNRGYAPPTLDDIRNALSSLKKVNNDTT